MQGYIAKVTCCQHVWCVTSSNLLLFDTLDANELNVKVLSKIERIQNLNFRLIQIFANAELRDCHKLLTLSKRVPCTTFEFEEGT